MTERGDGTQRGDNVQLLPAERLQRIRELLGRQGSVRVAALSRELGVSEVTIRSDLSQLEQEGFARRTHGGAVLARGTRYERPFAEQEARFREEKRRIGQAAARLVEDGDTIILDVGTTTTEVARHLPAGLTDVVVITSSLNIALELEKYPYVTVLVTGGTLRSLQHSLVNPYGTLLLSQVNADKLFLGCNGVSAAKGITNANLQEAEIKRAMIAAAKQVIVVADHSKIGSVAVAHVAPLSAVDRVVTDQAADPREVEHIRQAGVEVDLV
ncbi:MAG: DeoR/GlpR transcriptional regulator [Limnochordaceae bacterium]|nr:DeoR/GlpR transcriptional regulator [Limnochordaceae bacterium]